MADNRESDPSSRLQDFLVFGEYGGVNPSIEDSSTFTFLSPEKMRESFYHEIEGCFLYSRHWNPTNKYLADALSLMEGSESCQVTSSGMAAISCTILQLCRSGDEIISADTVYGGTYALLKNFLSKFGIITKFVNIADHEKIKSQITDKTKLIFCESFSNPLLVVADIPLLSAIAKKHNIKLVVDNTFSPLIISPIKLGADIVIHSMTKFINGMSDCLGGCICSSKQFIIYLCCVHNVASM
ncbi:MAG: aminotransferase class I/II-fold pyridoxal phosphate-dependent enzyme, partial [Planctomycetes bacterium]|nr:aminotransferase class I/II-fold pyridoxal phosphate-dependent enzyme [Planctomycetota bacterium]